MTLNELRRWILQATDRRRGPRARRVRQFHGRFEQLETRSMLSATVGPSDLPVDPHIDMITDIFFIVPSPLQQFAQPSTGRSESGSPEASHGDAGWLAPANQPQKALSPHQQSSWVASTVTASSDSGGTVFDVSAINSFGDSTHFDLHTPLISDAVRPGLEHILAQYGAESLIPAGGPQSELRRFATLTEENQNANHTASTGATQPGSPHVGGENGIGPIRPAYPGPDRTSDWRDQPAEFYLSDSSLASAALVGQSASATSISQRAYDSVFQSYAAQLLLLTMDSDTSNGISFISFPDNHLNLDDSQGGFVELDQSNPVDKDSIARTEFDLERDTIDTLMANLQDFCPSKIGDLNGDATSQDPSSAATDGAPFADADSWIGGAEQGGMVALRTASAGGDLISLAGAAEAPINWNVPASNVEIEAAVGMYQAFDVATGELSSTDVTTPAPAVVAPAAKHDHDAKNAKNHVSTDKIAKPALDQASAWVEMLTVAVVAGASKKERKTRAKA